MTIQMKYEPFLTALDLERTERPFEIAEINSKTGNGKGKAIPVQVWTGRQGSRRQMIPDFQMIGILMW
jgi:hypothetical protein